MENRVNGECEIVCVKPTDIRLTITVDRNLNEAVETKYVRYKQNIRLALDKQPQERKKLIDQVFWTIYTNSALSPQPVALAVQPASHHHSRVSMCQCKYALCHQI